MIVVLADDLSGAAELAGIGASLGLSSEVWLHPSAPRPGPLPELVVIDCASRCLAPREAVLASRQAARQALGLAPELIYKKVDSMLRGHVAEECAAVAEECGCERVLIVPSNPSHGRLVRNGHLFVDGEPAHQTSFAHDSRFPIRSSRVDLLLQNRTGSAMTIPDVRCADDLAALPGPDDEGLLLAGAADYFRSLLERRGCTPVPARPGTLTTATLWVSGSREAWRRGCPDLAEAAGYPVHLAPDQPRQLPALVAIGDERSESPEQLLHELVEVASHTVRTMHPRTLAIEGGDTASALIRNLGWDCLLASPPGDHRVALLTPHPPVSGAPTIVFKPGSYPWPVGMPPRQVVP